MNAFKKTVFIGYALNAYRPQRETIHAQIAWDGERLSITGVMGAKANGDATGGFGQIDETLRGYAIEFAPEWTAEKLGAFLDDWKAHHLNDMHAGTVEQDAELAKHVYPGHPMSRYEWALSILKAANLSPDANGYKYGSAWLKREVPEEALQRLAALPAASVPLPRVWERT